MDISVKKTYTTVLLSEIILFFFCDILPLSNNYFVFGANLEFGRYALNLSWPHISDITPKQINFVKL